MRRIALLALICAATSQAADMRPLTLEAAIETTRAMVDHGLNSVFVSPNGQRYAALLVRGDIRRDGVEVELIAGRLNTLQGAAPRTVVKFFTSGLGALPSEDKDSSILTWHRFNPPVWLDNEHVRISWEDDQQVHQLVSIGVDTQEIKYLTKHPTDILIYGSSAQGASIYAARNPYPYAASESLKRDGFTVTAPDAYIMLNGLVQGVTSLQVARDYEYYLTTARHVERRVITGPWVDEVKGLSLLAFTPKFSPDGRLAIVLRQPAVVPAQWEKYGAAESHYEMGWKSYPNDICQLFVVDVANATARPLWNAPVSLKGRKDAAVSWSADGRSLLVAPAFLPLLSDKVSGKVVQRDLLSAAVVDVATGEFRQVPVSRDVVNRLDRGRWVGRGLVELALDDDVTMRFEDKQGRWTPVPAKGSQDSLAATAAPVRVELREDMNTPPALYAVERSTDREQMVFDLNPGLKDRFSLGKVQMTSWTDRGHDWEGKLFYPVDYRPGRRYPLVIQTHGYEGPEFFTLYGRAPGLGPGYAVYIAQVLANHGTAVLQLDIWKDAERSWSDVSNIDDVISGFVAGARHLADIGLVDLEKVGLEGFSRTNWQVHYALTHSEFPYTAAIGVDGIDGSYLQAVLGGWNAGVGEDLNGAAPFAQGMESWLERSPALNAHRVRTPFQMMNTSSPGGPDAATLSGWEMFSRLRYMNKPVEYYIAPNILRGSHGLQNPRQVLAVQNRALDWWLFWLKGEELSSQTKTEQYRSWRKLREQRDEMLKTPRPPPLDWTAVPRRDVTAGR